RRLSLPQAGVDGLEQPLPEVGRVRLHPHNLAPSPVPLQTALRWSGWTRTPCSRSSRATSYGVEHARPSVQQRLHLPEVALRHTRQGPGARVVDQEGLAVPAHRPLAAAEVPGDAGNAPASTRQADHVQAVAGAGA
ncbi:MAG: hypothetical protein M3R02_29235, partial [Chloroflexota bacterium]|nr:hypothetical protein [Chloroflexota bacterium]